MRRQNDNRRSAAPGRDRDRAPRDQKSRDRDYGARPGRRTAKFHLAKGTKIDYKDMNLLQKYVSDRGKILSRRFTGVSAKEQRAIVREIKKARFLGLLHIMGIRKQ